MVLQNTLLPYALTFNSLCEIQQGKITIPKDVRKLSTLYVRFTKSVFAYILWIISAFNSLCEILDDGAEFTKTVGEHFQLSM